MNAQSRYARLAGVMYLVVLALDISGAVIGSAVGGAGSFSDVSHRIVASETLYRLGLCLALAGSLSTVPLAVALYETVRPFDGGMALIALLFRIGEAAIGGMGIAVAFFNLEIYLAPGRSGGLGASQLGALADLAAHEASTQVSAIFFSFGSTIFFWVFVRSGYIPRLLSAWGVFASLLYAAAWFFSLVLPQASGIPLAAGSVPILIAEVGTALWLLIRGVRVPAVSSQATPSTLLSAPSS